MARILVTRKIIWLDCFMADAIEIFICHKKMRCKLLLNAYPGSKVKTKIIAGDIFISEKTFDNNYSSILRSVIDLNDEKGIKDLVLEIITDKIMASGVYLHFLSEFLDNKSVKFRFIDNVKTEPDIKF